MHRVSEAMRIASLVARRLVLSVAAKSRREVARQNQTSAYCSAGRIQWRVHNACARTAKSAPDASTIRNTGLVRATSRVLSPFLHFSFPSVSLSILEDHRHITPGSFSTLSSASLRPRGCETARGPQLRVADRDVSVPLQVVNETRICLSASRCSCRCLPLSCHGHCLHRE